MKQNILDIGFDTFREQVVRKGILPYKADQVFEWIYRKHVYSFREMTNLSREHQDILSESWEIRLPKMVDMLRSVDGTVKFLLELHDGNVIECVLMEYSYGYSLCISSQSGCRMGCVFCASGDLGFDRNLSPGEMTGQVLAARREIGLDVSRVVIMGIGEPFDNFNNLKIFLDLASSPKGLEIGGRKITVSTCGVVPGILAFADLGLQVNLSVSLHQADDRKRSLLMPVNNRYPLRQLIEACRTYVQKTNRRISFEYAVMPGINDGESDAYALGKLLSGLLCYINIIQVNDPGNHVFSQNIDKEQTARFRDILKKQGLHVTVRRELGKDIKAACGQLRRRHIL